MKIAVLHPDQLTPAHLDAWSRCQRADLSLESPFFRPEFTQAVAAVRRDVRVAVLEEGDEPAGFFPFQYSRWGVGRPVGGPLSDYQGVVARQGLEWNADALIRACGLAAWEFDHLVASQRPFQRYHYATGSSAIVDLSAGFEAYQASQRAAGSRVIPDLLKSLRRIEREVGPVRFEANSADPSHFARLLEWKGEQYRCTGSTNVFAFQWAVRLLERVLRQRNEAFSGMLSVLYAGGQLAAVELGIRSFGVLHGWFPAYNRALAKYSPGLILQMMLAETAPSLGIQRLDLGKGTAAYKRRFMSGTIPLAEGCVALYPVGRLVRRGLRRTRDWVRTSPLEAAARVAGRWTRPLRGWLKFQ